MDEVNRYFLHLSRFKFIDIYFTLTMIFTTVSVANTFLIQHYCARALNLSHLCTAHTADKTTCTRQINSCQDSTIHCLEMPLALALPKPLIGVLSPSL